MYAYILFGGLGVDSLCPSCLRHCPHLRRTSVRRGSVIVPSDIKHW